MTTEHDRLKESLVEGGRHIKELRLGLFQFPLLHAPIQTFLVVGVHVSLSEREERDLKVLQRKGENSLYPSGPIPAHEREARDDVEDLILSHPAAPHI